MNNQKQLVRECSGSSIYCKSNVIMRNPTYFSCPKISISKIIGREQWVEDVSTSSALKNDDVAISVFMCDDVQYGHILSN